MATFSLLSRNFEVPETSKTFLENYLGRVQSYVSKNHLDVSLYDDLAERLVEKLHDIESADNGITEKSIVSIVNSLGEPEDIFRDLLETTTTPSTPKITKEDVKDFFQREFHRNQKEGVVLGVCAGLGETFGINPIWLRLGFIILTLAYGINFIVYIVLGILLPDISRKGAPSGNEPMEKKIERQANEFAEDLESRAKTYTNKDESSITNAFSRLIRSVIRTIVAIFRTIGLLIVFALLSGIALAFFGIGMSTIVAGGIVSTNFIIQSEELFAYIPAWFGWVALASGIAFIILSIMLASRALRKPVGNGWLAIICVSILVGGVFGGVKAGMMVANNYQFLGEKTITETSLKTTSGATYALFETSQPSTDGRLSLGEFSDHGTIEIVPSEDATMTIKVIASLRAKDETKAKEILESVTASKIETQSGSITISREKADNYSRVVPFSFLQRNIKISVPKNVILTLKDSRHRIINLEETNEYGSRGHTRFCTNLPITFDPVNNSFVCQEIEKTTIDE